MQDRHNELKLDKGKWRRWPPERPIRPYVDGEVCHASGSGNACHHFPCCTLLRAVLGVVLLIGELPREEPGSVEAVLNHCLDAFHAQKDDLSSTKDLCAQIDFVRGSRNEQEGRVHMADAEPKRSQDEMQQLREKSRALRRE